MDKLKMLTSDKLADRLLIDIQICQKNIVQADVKVKNLIVEVCSCRGTKVDLNRVCQSAKDSLKDMQNAVAQLEILAPQVKSIGDREEMVMQVKRHNAEIDINKQSLRRATLQSIQAIESRDRDQLLSGGLLNNQGVKYRKVQGKDQGAQLRTQTSNVTSNLTSLVCRMEDQVKHSESTLGTLVGSSQVLGETETEFHDMSGTIQSSGKLISKYARRELSDKILIALALCLFFGTVLYIVRKRLLWFW